MRGIARMGAVLFVGLLLLPPRGGAADSPPNILVILADDMGYGDAGVLGSRLLRTPYLDALARSGVICRQAYVASSVCSPSRAGLMTGRDPRRFGYEENLNQAASNYATRPELLGLAPGEHTLGDHLGAFGYDTALIGKWHLGTGKGFHPNERGFDYFCGMLGGSHTYFPDPDRNRLERNGKPLREFSNPYLTDFFTDEAIRWLNDSTTRESPWFLFMAYNAPHGPMEATEADLERFAHIESPRRRTYAAMMFALDRGVGRLQAWLERHQQKENTLIVFFSDNGGATNNASWNGALSGTKGTLREGGVRVPMFWTWPSQIPARKHLGVPVSSLDLLPTFAAAAGGSLLPLRAPLPHEHRQNYRAGVERFGAYDGIDLLPFLINEPEAPQRTLFWRLQGQAAILSGQDKVIRLAHRPAQFFRPNSDLGEQNDLANASGDRLGALLAELAAWEALLPTIPLWGSSPYWQGQSARQYDSYPARSEPR